MSRFLDTLGQNQTEAAVVPARRPARPTQHFPSGGHQSRILASDSAIQTVRSESVTAVLEYGPWQSGYIPCEVGLVIIHVGILRVYAFIGLINMTWSETTTDFPMVINCKIIDKPVVRLARGLVAVSEWSCTDEFH